MCIMLLMVYLLAMTTGGAQGGAGKRRGFVIPPHRQSTQIPHHNPD